MAHEVTLRGLALAVFGREVSSFHEERYLRELRARVLWETDVSGLHRSPEDRVPSKFGPSAEPERVSTVVAGCMGALVRYKGEMSPPVVAKARVAYEALRALADEAAREEKADAA